MPVVIRATYRRPLWALDVNNTRYPLTGVKRCICLGILRRRTVYRLVRNRYGDVDIDTDVNGIYDDQPVTLSEIRRGTHTPHTLIHRHMVMTTWQNSTPVPTRVPIRSTSAITYDGDCDSGPVPTGPVVAHAHRYRDTWSVRVHGAPGRRHAAPQGVPMPIVVRVTYRRPDNPTRVARTVPQPRHAVRPDARTTCVRSPYADHDETYGYVNDYTVHMPYCSGTGRCRSGIETYNCAGIVEMQCRTFIAGVLYT